LLLVDLAMPDMTGVAAVQRISEWRPGLPWLLLSLLEMNRFGQRTREDPFLQSRSPLYS
jgi:CheY-like chemotaxis protein